ncbi:hypothetical protein BHE74_00052276 [Ensete ventricosum]|nr:hypothetical protein BHE74_00052276 [Ensete ventricosum]
MTCYSVIYTYNGRNADDVNSARSQWHDKVFFFSTRCRPHRPAVTTDWRRKKSTQSDETIRGGEFAKGDMEGKYRELRTAVDAVAAVDGHAHNLVDIDSSFPFLRCFSEAEGDALSLAPHTLSFKVSMFCAFSFPRDSLWNRIE